MNLSLAARGHSQEPVRCTDDIVELMAPRVEEPPRRADRHERALEPQPPGESRALPCSALPPFHIVLLFRPLDPPPLFLPSSLPLFLLLLPPPWTRPSSSLPLFLPPPFPLRRPSLPPHVPLRMPGCAQVLT